VFLKEYASNTYSSFIYFWSKVVVELPLTFVQVFISVIMAYYFMGLHANIVLLILVLWLLAIASCSIAVFLACSVSTAESAIQFAPLIFIPQILFCGVFVPVSAIPSYLRWCQYL